MIDFINALDSSMVGPGPAVVFIVVAIIYLGVQGLHEVPEEDQ
jgi:hypothetical protein